MRNSIRWFQQLRPFNKFSVIAGVASILGFIVTLVQWNPLGSPPENSSPEASPLKRENHEEFSENIHIEKGDYVRGDLVKGDKVGGDRIEGNKIIIRPNPETKDEPRLEVPPSSYYAEQNVYNPSNSPTFGGDNKGTIIYNSPQPKSSSNSKIEQELELTRQSLQRRERLLEYRYQVAGATTVTQQDILSAAGDAEKTRTVLLALEKNVKENEKLYDRYSIYLDADIRAKIDAKKQQLNKAEAALNTSSGNPNPNIQELVRAWLIQGIEFIGLVRDTSNEQVSRLLTNSSIPR